MLKRSILLLALFAIAMPATPADAPRFVGTWRLVSITVDGKIDPVRGQHPTGLLFYDKTGHMAVQIMPDRARPKFAGAAPTPEEAQAALTGYVAYFGMYSVDERTHTITHHRAGNLNPGGINDAVRRYEFVTTDRLILVPVDSSDHRLTWERVR